MEDIKLNLFKTVRTAALSYVFVAAVIGQINTSDSIIVRNLLDVNGHTNVDIKNYIEVGRPGDGSRIVAISIDSLTIDSMPQDLATLSFLQSLSLTNNQLKTLPDFLATRKFVVLEIQNNLLDSIPDVFFDSTQDYWGCNFKGNRIRNLPERISEVRAQFLGFPNNELRSIPRSITENTNIEFLNLDSNYLCNVPDEIKNYISSIALNPEWESTQICPVPIAKSRSKTDFPQNTIMYYYQGYLNSPMNESFIFQIIQGKQGKVYKKLVNKYGVDVLGTVTSNQIRLQL